VEQQGPGTGQAVPPGPARQGAVPEGPGTDDNTLDTAGRPGRGPRPEGASLRPPAAPRRPVVLSAHGDERRDDWFWLRDADDPEVIAHLEAENAYTEAVMAPWADLRRTLFEEMISRIREDDVSVPVRRGGWWYYQRTARGRNYPVHCRCPAAPGGGHDWEPPDVTAPRDDERIVLDVNRLAEGGTYLALGTLEPSPDQRWLAYSLDRKGEERFDLRFRRLDGAPPHSGITTGAMLPMRPGDDGEAADDDSQTLHAEAAQETITNTSYGGGWADDNSCFFYTRLDEAMRPYQVWRHQLGDDPAHDLIVHEEADQRFHLSVERTLDGAFVVIHAHSSVTSEIHVIRSDRPTESPRVVEPRRQGIEYTLDHAPGVPDGWFVILTNDDAEDFKVMVTPDDRPGREHWYELLPHRPGVRVEDVTALAGRLLVGERLEGEPRLRVMRWPPTDDGPLSPGASSLVPESEHPSSTWVGAHGDFATPYVRYEQTSLVTPRSVLELTDGAEHPMLRKRQAVLGDFDPRRYRTFRLWARSDDGVEVPLSVVHRADLLDDPEAAGGTPPAAPAPCVMYGYGAYEHSVDPVFSSLRLSLLDRGFVWAIAHVRGGGELGRRWYEDGKLGSKAHTFGDFIACARLLVDQGWTTPDVLAARGGSAGGLLVGAVANLAPELFGAIVAEVPFVDALTTILDETLPLSVIEWEEWGNPGIDPAIYATMKSYSPYDNVRDRDESGAPLRYPDILVTAGLGDPRVGFWEPAKWVARLRQANPANRVLLKTELGAGHGGPSGRYDAWRDEAMIVAFLLDALGQVHQGTPGSAAATDRGR
jgi:oligopeptidase B